MSTPDERIAALEAEVAGLRAQEEDLRAPNRQLPARLAKDRHTSSQPPSSDGLQRKMTRLRTPSGKEAGGQRGQRGETRHWVATPAAVVAHGPAVCRHCQTPRGETVVVGRERRQVPDLPPVRLVMTAQQALRLRCPTCQALTAGTFPAAAPRRAPARTARTGAPARCSWCRRSACRSDACVPLLADLSGVRVGRGTLVSWIRAERHARS